MSASPKNTGTPRNTNPGYTDDDIQYGPLLKWILSLWVATGLTFTVLIWFLRDQRDSHLDHNAPAAERILPPANGPLLQAYPIRDLDEYLSGQKARLHTYGVVDAEKGVYQIPVEQAISRILEKGDLKSN